MTTTGSHSEHYWLVFVTSTDHFVDQYWFMLPPNMEWVPTPLEAHDSEEEGALYVSAVGTGQLDV